MRTVCDCAACQRSSKRCGFCEKKKSTSPKLGKVCWPSEVEGQLSAIAPTPASTRIRKLRSMSSSSRVGTNDEIHVRTLTRRLVFPDSGPAAATFYLQAASMSARDE